MINGVNGVNYIAVPYTEQNSIRNYIFDDEGWLELHSTDDKGKTGEVWAKLSYNLKNLYVILKSKQYSITNRDRAYQNGDGFHFVLSRTDIFPAKEFFVVAVSPLNEEKPVFVWYRNMDLQFNYLEKSEVITLKEGEYYYFVVALKWSDLEWCNPALTRRFGFNISYVEAENNGECNTYILEDDGYIQCEECHRNFVKLKLEKVQSKERLDINCTLKARNMSCGENPVLSIISSQNHKNNISVKVQIDGKHVPNKNYDKSIECKNTPWDYNINYTSETFGKHDIKVEFYLKGKLIYLYEDKFCIFSKNIILTMQKHLKDFQCHGQLGKYSKETLEYELYNTEQMMKKLLPYEVGENIINSIEKFLENLELASKLGHIFIGGERRYALVSKYDGTLQPYTMYLPKNINKETRLLVYLHGSGANDIGAFSKKAWATLSEQCNVILVAPNGRGVSNCFCPVETREDIKQLVLMCGELFHISNEQVILSGFSMGGYGVLRVYHGMEHIFHKLLIMSGSPDLGMKWQCTYGVDYVNTEEIKAFNLPEIMIVHSKNDLNCPYHDMEKFVNKLKIINDKMIFLSMENAGHTSLTEEILDQVMKFIG